MKTQLHVWILLTLFASTALAQSNSPTQTNTSSQTNAQTRAPVIDVHMHAYAKDARWDHKVGNPITGREMTATNEQAHMHETLAEMKKYNIVKALVSTHYEAVLRWKAAASDSIIPAYGFDDLAQVNLEFLRKEHAAGRLQALGEVGIQYSGLAPNDPKMEPIYALAEELDLPLGIHIGLSKPGVAYDDSPKYRAALSNPMLLEEVLLRHPKMRLYVMHAGWPMLDQMVWPDVIGPAIEGIESAAFLSEEQKRDILYNNAVRFLRLDKK